MSLDFVLIRVLQRSWTNRRDMYLLIYDYEELVHMIIETKKSHICELESQESCW